MNTFLLSWNPKRWEWKATDLAATILEVQAKGGSEERWSCGNRRALPRGSRFFLIRLGPLPRGLIGSGTTISEPSLGPHWDRAQTKLALYVDIRFDFLAREPLVSWTDLVKGPLGSFGWGIQASGVALPDAIAVPLEQLWSRRVAGDEPLIPDEVSDEMDFAEGSRKQITVNAAVPKQGRRSPARPRAQLSRKAG